MSTSELACVYAALALHDDGVELSAENINKMCSAAGITVEPYWAPMFVKLFEAKGMDDLITNVGSGGGGGGGGAAPAAAGGDGGDAPAAAAAPVEESEEDDDNGFDLFD